MEKNKHTACHVKIDAAGDILNKTLRRFWEAGESPTKHFLLPEDKYCETLFTEITTRDNEIRFVVRLPFKKVHWDYLENLRVVFDASAKTETGYSLND